ncbi:MAG: thiamine pyrophosphate-dependent dehydrogenase E1 component subunit alpha [Thermoanaerobaculia bacterium]|nr:thiamine pyrophosphate-dependent dehydrogenase E1 component subunit alpha [Thermoanaerobaculia bacterium]
MTDVSPEIQKNLYRFMLLTRLLEERLVNLYRQGKIVGGFYRSLGQEATAVGTAMALAEGDIFFPVIRDLGATLVRGVAPRQILCQQMAREGSPSRGRDGVLHFSIPEKGIYAPIAMLGTAVPVMSGMLLADRYLGKKTVGLTYLGDGASSVGAFHEGINFAGVNRLPLVVVFEFNRWAYSTPYEKQCGAMTLADKAPGYGLSAKIVDGNDVLAVYEAARTAIDHARSGNGPFLLECKTYRLKGHAEHDAQSYIDRAEIEEWKKRDPIARFEKRLGDDGVLFAAGRDEIRHEISRHLDEDVDWAEAQPSPLPDYEFRGVYADEDLLVERQQEIFVGGDPS